MARYGRVAIVLHWAIGLLLLAEIAFGFLLDDIAPRGTPWRGVVVNLHKSVGVVLIVLGLLRLAWRLRHRPPPWPATLPPWRARAATAMHRALYAAMIGAPLAGYVGSNFSRHGVRFFGHPFAPWGPDLPAVYAFCNQLHVALSWALGLLIALHVAAAAEHALHDDDGVFARMWPGWRSRHRQRVGQEN